MGKEIVFLSGKYRGDTDNNMAYAGKVARRLWQQGYIVICPHLNTARFDGICAENVWLEGYLEILKRCDSIYMLKNWQESKGAQAELILARTMKKRIYWE